MPPDSGPCPSSGELTRFLELGTQDPDLPRITSHLTHCQPCWDAYFARLRPSKQIGIPGYHVVEEIGSGAASVVYAVWRTTGARAFRALKIRWPINATERARFLREVEIHRSRVSPYIVRCHSAGELGSLVYYEMDYVHGCALNQYLDESAHTLHERLAVFKRVCDAVASVHTRGVSHRDLKPSNILIDAQGCPYLLDFGLGRMHLAVGDCQRHQTQTRTGDLMGTIRYMPPEQAWGGLINGPIDQQSDVWALGIMLLEAVTGAYPYETTETADRDAEQALLHRIRTESPTLPALSGSRIENACPK